MKVYIAGKITGDPGYRDKFAAAEIQLGGEAAIKAIYKSCGFTIWCQCKDSSCDARTVGYCPNISEEDRALENIESCKNKAAEAWNRRVNDG